MLPVPDGVLCPNVMRCTICGGVVDRYSWGFGCRSTSGHMGDLMTGIMTDCTHPEDMLLEPIYRGGNPHACDGC